MADIELVIKIPKFIYDQILKSHVSKTTIAKIFSNSTILPKGHGRLIDADNLEYTCNSDECGILTGCNHCQYHIITEDEIDSAPTIIEADNGEE